ncbi:MAG: AAA family ATPase, partial [Bacteroidetes bacterium]|nr:AAA family ATPase [Bacteroidota bacterium]
MRYWVYAPGYNASHWDEFYSKGIMGLGWDELGDLNNYQTKEDIVKRLQELEKTEGSKKNDATANDEFKNVMAIGDIVFVKTKRDEFIGYGIVSSDYYYDDSRTDFKKCRKVDWQKKGIWKANH